MTGPVDPVLVSSEEYRVAEIAERAARRSEAMRHPTATPSFALQSNVLGLCAELAWLAHLRRSLPRDWSVRWIADQASSAEDLLVCSPNGQTFGLEVKSTSPEFWRQHGRVVGTDQLYATTAVAYLWSFASRAASEPDVYLLGWTTTEETRALWKPVNFTGVRSAMPRESPRAVLPDSERPTYIYDLDDVGLDEYELAESCFSSTMTDGQVDEAEPDDGVSLSNSPSVSTAGWTEGAAPMPGFGKVKELSRVEATLRDVRSLPAWLREGLPD